MNDSALGKAREQTVETLQEAGGAVGSEISQTGKAFFAQLFGEVTPMTDEVYATKKAQEERERLSAINRLHQEAAQLTINTTRPRENQNTQPGLSQPQQPMSEMQSSGLKSPTPPLPQKSPERRGGRGVGG